MIAAIGILARIAVGFVLLIAGVSKLRTRTWGLLALESGTPRPVVITLPAVEVLLGAAMVLQLFPAWLPWVGVVLFGAFLVVVVRRFVTGSEAGCNCFGSKRSQEPVDALTIVRNVVLIVVAVASTLR
jgi:hypothetical protein